MDKEQEKLIWQEWIEETSDFLGEGLGDGIPIKLRKVLPQLIAERVTELGYRKPLDIPELREKIAEELYYQNFRPEARGKVISWETISDITRSHFLEDADQILAIIPKDKPPQVNVIEMQADVFAESEGLDHDR